MIFPISDAKLETGITETGITETGITESGITGKMELDMTNH